MPFIEDKDSQAAFMKAIGSPEFETEVPFMDVARAAFRQENVIGSYLAQENGLPDSAIDDNFNPFDLLTDEEKLDDLFLENVALADNKGEIDAVRRQRDKERDDRHLLATTGADGVFASTGFAAIDLVNFIPVGGVSYRTYRVGGSILAGAAATGSVAAGTTAAQEMLLHHTQIERTMGESAVNISVATLFGATLGGAAGAFKGLKQEKAFKEMEEVFNPEPVIARGGDSVGAAAAFEDVQVKGKAGQLITKLLAFDPLSRTVTSKNSATRKVSAQLAESPIAFEKGISDAAVETKIKLHDGKYADALQKHHDAFKVYKQNDGALKRKDFNSAVASEMRNPKADAAKEIKQAANDWRARLYDPLKNEAIAVKFLPEDVGVETAESYLNRVWNKNKLARNLGGFTKTVSKWLQQEQPGQDIDYDALAREIGSRIMATPDGRLPYDYKIGENSARSAKPSDKKGLFKKRSFLIPDDMIEEFLENDIEVLGARYLRGVAPDVELARAFDGDVNMTAAIKEIEDEWLPKIEAASGTKEADKLTKQRNNDIRDIAAMRDRLRGTYGQIDPDNLAVRSWRAARDLNYLRLMGGVVAASIPDISRIVMAEGIVNTFGKGLKPLISNTKGFKVAASEAKQYGIGVDVLMGGRSEIIADVADYSQGGTAFERGLRSAAQSFGKINLMDRWTAGVKQLHAVTMQNTLIPALKRGDYDKRLAQLGISEADAKNIGKQLKKYSTNIDGAHLANAKDWDNPALMDMWGAAMRKESDRVIVVPGQEKPLFMSSELGKTIFQFKSFMFSATQRVLISGVQGQDAHFIQGALGMMSLGMMAYAFKQWDAGRDISDDPMVWVTEGIDRSGMLGILMEMNNTVEKISRNNYGLRPMLGASAPASRYASRSNVEAALGPTFGSLLSTTFRALGATTGEGDMKDSDIRAIRRLLPYQNLMIFRQGLDKVEESLE